MTVVRSIGGINMKIGVDAGCLGIKDERLKVGVYNVVKNFLIELVKLDKDNIYLLYSFEEIDKNLMAKFGKNFRNIVVRPKKGWLKVWLPLRIFLDKPKVFLALNQSVFGSRFFFLDFARVFDSEVEHLSAQTRRDQNDKARGMKIIGFIYDVAFEEFPEMYVPSSVPKMSKNSKDLAMRADHIITISEWTKKEIIRLYKVNANKIHVEYPGVSILTHPRGGLEKDGNYFLFVGALKKSKNIPLIIMAFGEFLKKTKEKYYLYIVGGDKWLDKEINKTIKKLDLKDYIKIFGYVNDKTLLKLYKEAFAFISPSLYEGFGITLLEAMSLSCPVIAGNNTAQKEVVGEAGLLVNPNDLNSVKNVMLSMVNDKYLRSSLIKKGLERSKLFSWNKFAMNVYKKIKEYEHKTN